MAYRVPRQVLVYVHRPAGAAHEFLLLLRVPERGGFWQGVSGAPEWGEADPEAARREVREETGLEVVVEPVDFRYVLLREDSDTAFWDRLYGPGVEVVPEEVYAAQPPSGWEPTLAPSEHVDFRWCGLDEAISLLKWEDNRRALAVAAEYVEAGPRLHARPSA
jgi:lipoyl(octanoyl) transferase